MRKYAPVFLLLILSFIWGSSFILMKMGMYQNNLPVFSPQQVAALRLSLAFLVLLPFAVIHIRRVNKKHLLPIALVGIFGNGIPAFLFTAAEEKLESAVAGMLNATTPVFAVILGIVFFGMRLNLVNYLGVVLGFSGACLLMLANGVTQFSADFSFAGLVLMATSCYALSVNIIRYYLGQVHPMAVTSLAFVVIGIPATCWVFYSGSITTLQTHPYGNQAFVYVAILGLVGTALAVFMFNYLVKLTNAVYASTVTYLMPVTSMFWGLYFNESVNPLHAVGIVIILAGVYLSTRK